MRTNSCQQDVGALLGGGTKIPVTSSRPCRRLTLGARLGSSALAAGLVTPGSVGTGQEGSREEREGFPFPEIMHGPQRWGDAMSPAVNRLEPLPAGFCYGRS